MAKTAEEIMRDVDEAIKAPDVGNYQALEFVEAIQAELAKRAIDLRDVIQRNDI